MGSDVAERALVVGLAVAGASAARALKARGTEVVASDDEPERSAHREAQRLGIPLVERPDRAALRGLVAGVDLVVPSPGVPAHHPVFELARAAGVRVWSEFELAARWSSVPLVAITGTNGKTTVTNLATEMLRASGVRATAAGNNELPLVDAIDSDVDVIVVEASSFRLKFTETFRPAVAAWLNLAPDHLDWHPSMADYAAAKARIWAGQRGDDVAVVNADDPEVMAAASTAPARVMTFSLSAAGDYHRAGDRLVGPDGETLAFVSELPRAFPHDLANALAASASALNAGGTLIACRSVLASFRGFPHRVTFVRDAGGVRYYDDSKATTPASVLAATSAFESVVLIAGGRNKGLDLSVLRETAPPVRAVVAIGEAQPEITAAFAGRVPVIPAASMDEAVAAAAETARPGDVVLLSPACASFDWYASYGERGDDFARAVRALPQR
jgi:UDP-N-acetylmuramoylalanine--D-glutamate ligase